MWVLDGLCVCVWFRLVKKININSEIVNVLRNIKLNVGLEFIFYSITNPGISEALFALSETLASEC